MEKNIPAQTLPHSTESEMMVLGCMLTSAGSLTLGAESLEANDFYHTEHQVIFQALKNAYRNSKPADLHLIEEALKQQNQLQQIGGACKLRSIAQYAGTSSYIEEYIQTVKNKSLLRAIILKAHSIQEKALSNPDDPSELVFEAHDTFNQIYQYGSAKDKFPIRFLNQMEQNPLFIEPEKKPMLLECMDNNNASIGYLPKSIVAMLVGAGGVGKTHLLAQLAISLATGEPFLDTFITTAHCGPNKRGNVFLGFGENQDDDIARILFKASRIVRSKGKAILEDASKRIAPFSFCGQNATFIEAGKPTRYFRDFKRCLIDTAPEEGWSLIILDPVSRLLGADAETDNASATQFIALLEELTIDLPGNPTILFAHHVNKAALGQGGKQNQSASRGSSGLTDGVRWQVNLAKEDREDGEAAHIEPPVILKMTKTNFTAILEEIYLQNDGVGSLIRHEQEADLKKAKKSIKQQPENRKAPPKKTDKIGSMLYEND